MRILILSWRDPKNPLAGGAEQVVLEHAKGWYCGGHKVTWFSSSFNKSIEEEMIDGIKIIRSGWQYLGVQIKAFQYYLKNKNKFDLVIDQFHGLPFFTPLYIHKPIVAVLQEIAGKVWFLNELVFPINIIVGLVGFVCEPLFFLFYHKVPFIVGSDSTKNELINMGINKSHIIIIPHGVVGLKPIPFPKKEKIATITFLGALAKDKGVEDAIKVFSILNKKDNYQFWVIGKGSKEYNNKLIDLSKSLGLEKTIKFWGFVSQSEKFELLARSYILINPSRKEGWGLVNIEANTVGTPVVAYNSAGLVDSVKNGINGVTVNDNPQEMAEAVYRIIKDRRKYETLKKGALAWSQKFSWQKSREMSRKFIEAVGQPQENNI